MASEISDHTINIFVIQSPPPVLWSFSPHFQAQQQEQEEVQAMKPTEMVTPLRYDDTDNWMKPMRRDRDPVRPYKRWKAFLEGRSNPHHTAEHPDEISPFGEQWTVLDTE